MTAQTNKDELNKKVEFLKKQISDQIKRYTSSRHDNKWKALKFHILTTLLSAINTVVLGLDLTSYKWLSFLDNQTKNIALIISAVITVFGAYNTFFDHKGLWVNYTNLRNSFSNLSFELDYYLAGNDNIEEERIEQFKKQYIEILNVSSTKWTNLREG